MSSPLVFCGPEKTLKSIQSDLFLNREELSVDYQEVKNNHPFEHRIAVVNEDDFLVVIAARRRTLSYSHYFEQMPRDLARNYEKNNFIIIYPAQRTIETPVLSSALDGLEATPIPEKFERFINIGNNWKKSSDTRHNSATE